MQFSRLFCLLLLCAVLPACRSVTPTPAHPPVLIRLGVDDTAQALAQDLAQAYQQAHSYVRVQVSISNSSTVLRQFAQGSLDLALVSRSPQADELTQPPAKAIELARDGLVIVVNSSNPLTSLSRDQVAQIFAGDILNWSQLTGQAAKGGDEIEVVSREEGSGTRALFEQVIMAGQRVTLTALIQTNEQDVLSYIGANPNAVSYASFSNLKDNAPTRALAIDNIPASLSSIQSATYPLMQTLYLIAPTIPNPELANFVAFATSPDARPLITSRMALPR